MRKILLMTALLTACGNSEPITESIVRHIPADGIAGVVLLAKDATVTIRTAAIDVIKVDGVGETKVEIDETLRIDYGTGRLTITMPAGLRVVARVEAGNLDISGRFGMVSLTVLKGDVRVDADELHGGTLHAQTGNANFTTRGVPAESVTIKAPSGTADVTISPKFRGLAQLRAQAIDTPVDKRLAVRRSPGNATVMIGSGFTKKDHDAIPVDKRPGFWVTAKSAKLSLAD